MGQCCTSDRGLIKLPSLANDVIGNVRVQLYCIASVFNASSAHYHCWLELVNLIKVPLLEQMVSIGTMQAVISYP